MLKYAAAWLMMALLCSANAPTLQENFTVVCTPPLLVQTEDIKEMLTAEEAVYPEGLTESEWTYLQEEREALGALSFEERLSAVALPHIHCLRLVHIPWEHNIPRSLIRVAGQARYEVWVSEQSLDEKCTDIYSFAERFSIDLEELKRLLNEGESVYDMDKVARRYAYFNSGAKQDETGEVVYYQGLEERDWQFLQRQKVWFEALSDQEKDVVRGNGGIGCVKFSHLFWEEIHPVELIRYVGSDAFESWIRERSAAGLCSDVYSFAAHFSIDIDQFKALIEEYQVSDFYHIDTLERRWAYFNGDPVI